MSDIYELTADGVIDLKTGACIPNASDNSQWAKYQKWLSGITINQVTGEVITGPPNAPRPMRPTRAHVWDDQVEAWMISAEDQAAIDRVAFVKARAEDVAAIKVTTSAGHTFDGDEISQTRMARAIVGLRESGRVSIPWVLADNTVIEATVEELAEALELAGDAQSALWLQE